MHRTDENIHNGDVAEADCIVVHSLAVLGQRLVMRKACGGVSSSS